MKLIEKLKTNFQLANLLSRILFVVGFIFCNWQDLLFSANMVLAMMGMSTTVVIPMTLLVGIILGVIISLIVPFAINAALNFLRLYNIPRAEYVLIAMVFFDIGLFACGLLNLVNLFTPILLAWGGVIFPVVVSFGCMLGFYKVTANLYFNDVTRPYYFKNLAILYIVMVVIMGVFA